MTTRLPADPRLPDLATLFDEASVVTMLTAGLQPTGCIEITGCRPRYVRYKPETSCLVQYDLTASDALGERITTTAQIKVFADGRARRHAENAAARFQRWTSSLQRDPALPRVAYLVAVDGLLQIYPVDRDLRFLVRAADAGLMTDVLHHRVPAFAGASVLPEPELIRYKPERKALLRYRLRDGPVARWYGKVHAADRGKRLAAQTRRLIESGVATPSVLFTLRRHRFVAHAEAAGVQLASLRGSSAYSDWMEPLARSLRHVQSVAIPDLPRHGPEAIAAEIENHTRWLSRITPHLAPRLRDLSHRITSRLASLDQRLTTSHGDFYDDQALVSAGGLAIIDLDELRLSHPLLDAGNMLAHLTVAAARGVDLGPARDAFLTAVRQDTPWPEKEIALFEALALLKLAPGPFRRLEPDWAEGIERILELAEACLAQSAPARSPASAIGSRGDRTDPALLQLDTLQDRAAMSVKLAEATGDPSLTVTSIDLVRHKAGRRAVLRYEITGQSTGAAPADLLYGKTFASERGPRVQEISRLICSAAAFGPRVSLPDPVVYLPEVKLLVQKPVPGAPAAASLLAGDVALAGGIATALHRFHASGLNLGRAHDLARELSPLATRTDQVVARCPELRTCAEACLARIHEISQHPFPWRSRPVHRDFYHDQVLVADGKLAVLDLDDAALSEPTVDVANFAAHLMLLRAVNHGHAAALTTVEHAFMDTYRRLDPHLDRQLTRFLTATTLVRLAGIHVSRPNGESVAAALLDRAGVFLNMDIRRDAQGGGETRRAERHFL